MSYTKGEIISDRNVEEEVKLLVSSILSVETLIQTIERKGIPFREFIASKNEQGELPKFLVQMAQENKFVYSEDEFAALKIANQEEQKASFEETLASIPEEERTEDMLKFRPKSLHCVELYEDKGLEKLKNDLATFSFTFEQYILAEGKLLDVIDEEESETPIYTLRELIEILRVNGRKGIELQRYKGLGEMNADQLWETTMDPVKRTLIKVTIPDTVAADHMFTMLMGDEVPPRRAFIEGHALSVKNLDI